MSENEKAIHVEAIAEAVAERLSPQYAREKNAATFGDLYERWLKDYAKPYLTKGACRNYERMYANYFQCWKDVRFYEIKRGDVQAWISQIGEECGKTTANRARELMRTVYYRCIELEIIPDNYNPATKIRKFADVKRDRFLQAEELPRFFEALATLRYDATRDCLLACLLTAQRLGNVRTMRWDQIDFERETWTIPKTKNGTGHVVALTADMVALLRRRQGTSKSEWVFPSRLDPSKPITKLEKAWREVTKRAEIEGLRIHDLRRSHASWQAITGANISVIAKTLNHLDLNSTSIYARLNVDDQRRAMTIANDAMLTRARIRQDEIENTATVAPTDESAHETPHDELALRRAQKQEQRYQEVLADMIAQHLAFKAQPGNVQKAQDTWTYECVDDYAHAEKFDLEIEDKEAFLDWMANQRDYLRLCDVEGYDDHQAHYLAQSDRRLLLGIAR